MIDSQLLNAKIDDSGLDLTDISSALGITQTSLLNKINNKTPFIAAEIFILCDILHISSSNDKIQIFYPESLHISKH